MIRPMRRVLELSAVVLFSAACGSQAVSQPMIMPLATAAAPAPIDTTPRGLAADLSEWAPHGVPFAHERGRLSRPVRGNIVVAYGPVRRDDSRTRVRNPGVTYRVRVGADVRAVADGTVAYAGPIEGYGMLIILDHGSGVHTIYGGLGEVDVTVGQALAERDVMGRPTESGFASGREVYFAVREDGEARDPIRWLRSR